MRLPARLAVTGGTGFVGRHLIARMSAHGVLCRTLSRQTHPASEGVEMIAGDLRSRADVARLVQTCDAIVHLADSAEWSEEETAAVIDNLAGEADANHIRRFAHVSTADVVGASAASLIDEEAECKPANAYQRRKLLSEERLQRRLAGHVDLVILRPTAVFGPGGRNAVKLANDLRRDSSWKRSLRWSLLRRRSLNFVAVTNVVEAIAFALSREQPFRGERFIVSDDNDPDNNYPDFTSRLARSLGLSELRVATVPLIDRLLPLLLRLRRTSLANPEVRFSSEKLRLAGYRPLIGLRDEIERFAASLGAPGSE